MKIGIDSYCYHRFFGEVYPDQQPPKRPMTMSDFLKRARDLEVDGVSLESCFLPSLDHSYLAELKAELDACGLDRVLAWGHPDGLERGQNDAAFKDMVRTIPGAKVMGADVMRVVGSSLMFRHEDHLPQMKALIRLFKEAAKAAEAEGVKLAVENHIDFTGDEMVEIIEAVGSPYFGINFDTGNFIRLLDDPVAAMEKLAPYTFATHIKDLVPDKNASPRDWHFFSGVPVGFGLINNERLVELLAAAGYKGFLAVEIDHPHTDWTGFEDEMVGISVKNLRRYGSRFPG